MAPPLRGSALAAPTTKSPPSLAPGLLDYLAKHAFDYLGKQAVEVATSKPVMTPILGLSELLRQPPPRRSGHYQEPVCVASGDMVSCKIPGFDFIAHFPRPKGWPDRLGPNMPDYHHYDRMYEAPSRGGLWQALVDNPTAGTRHPATPEGTRNDASPMVGPYVPGNWNPVQSYVQTDPATGTRFVINVTQPGHGLFPGFVARIIEPAGAGRAIVHNVGAGTSSYQRPNGPFARTISGVWGPNTKGIIDSLDPRE